MIENIWSPWSRLILVGCVWSTATSCGELTAGGVGEATVLITGDTPTTATPAAPSAAQFNDVVGTVSATLQVFVGTTSDRPFVELTDGPRTVTVDIRGGVEQEIATRALDVDAYTRVRLVYQSVTAVVESGLVVDGRPVTGPVRVHFENDAARTTVQDAVFEIKDDQTSELVVALNASSWLRRANADTRQVPSDDFHGSVDTRPRGSDRR